jgi:RsiW-degrading membrane proteinase PrsW (M82 family)
MTEARVHESPRPEHLGWKSILIGGIVLFGVLAYVLLQTGNPNLYPTVVLIGSFLVPVAFVAFLYDHLHWSTLSFESVVWSFVLGGLLGILGASVLEPFLLPALLGESDTQGFGGALLVAVIEESSKLAAVVFVARRMERGGALDGLLLGTAVGMGFAAFESLGYSFTVLLASGGDVIASIEEVVLRAAIAPFSHGIWTGMVAAALFYSSEPRRWRFGPLVWIALAFVVVLHAAWDGLRVGGVVSILGMPISNSLIAVSLVGIGAFVVAYLASARTQRERTATG